MIYVPLENCLCMSMSSFKMKGFVCKLILGTIGQWGFFSLSHLLLYGASVYNGHLLKTITPTRITVHLSAELSLALSANYASPGSDSTTQPYAVCNTSKFLEYMKTDYVVYRNKYLVTVSLWTDHTIMFCFLKISSKLDFFHVKRRSKK